MKIGAKHGITDFLEVQHRLFLDAQSRDFPPFLTPERQSTPLNASPYLTTLESLRSGVALPTRAKLVRKLIAQLDALYTVGIDALFVLIGGSAIGPKPSPSDMDCVIFYELAEGAAAPRFEIKLLQIQREAKSAGLDLRFMPADGDPLILARTLLFYGMLYSKSEGSLLIERGLVLVDCRASIEASDQTEKPTGQADELGVVSTLSVDP